MNPCPCGYYGDSLRECACSDAVLRRYRRRLSGPLLDRIDLHVEVPRVPYEKLAVRTIAAEVAGGPAGPRHLRGDDADGRPGRHEPPAHAEARVGDVRGPAGEQRWGADRANRAAGNGSGSANGSAMRARSGVSLAVTTAAAPAVETSTQVRGRVLAARARQEARLDGTGLRCNAEMGPAEVRRHCATEVPAEALLRAAMQRLHLSARSYHRVLKLARTIADLAGAPTIGAAHVAEALQYRPRQEE
jgi:predicted ATPase with chaperone activity